MLMIFLSINHGVFMLTRGSLPIMRKIETSVDINALSDICNTLVFPYFQKQIILDFYDTLNLFKKITITINIAFTLFYLIVKQLFP